MKKCFLGLTLSFYTLFSFAQLNLDWARSGGALHGEGGHSVVTDDSGNVYTAGSFQYTVDFDPDPNSVFNLTSNGGSDIFIQKLDEDGNFVWAVGFGGAGFGFDVARSITEDGNGNLYITGNYQNTVNFNPNGNYTLTAQGVDVFILKLDINGNFIWAKSVGGSGHQGDIGRGISTDYNGNVLLTGYYHDTADFDPDPNITYNLITQGDWWDVFVLKLDTNGDFIWAKTVGQGTSHDVGYALDVSPNNDVLVTGYYSGTVDFDPSTSGTDNHTVVGWRDVFVLKLDENGDFVWARTFGGTGPELSIDISTDNIGNSYILGEYNNTVDFDPSSSGQFLQTANGSVNLFVEKLDEFGNFIWVKSLGNSTGIDAGALTTNNQSEVYFTGTFSGNLDFDPSPNSTHFLSPIYSSGMFIEKLNSQGVFQSVDIVEGPGTATPNSIQTNTEGDVHIVGNFTDTVDFDPGQPVLDYISNGNSDFFVMKLSTCGSTHTDTIVSCGPYTWVDGNTYTTSNNTATYTYQDISGLSCDSVVTLYLTVEELTPNFSYTLSDPNCDGIGIELQPNGNNNGNYNWSTSFGESSSEESPSFVLPYNGTHSVNLEIDSDNGCSGQNSQTISIDQLTDYFQFKIPNVFTPNNDGNNDKIIIKGTEELSPCSDVSIYNRWGKLIHQTSGSYIEWDGKLINGKEAPEGTYYYLIQVQELEYQGNFTLMR